MSTLGWKQLRFSVYTDESPEKPVKIFFLYTKLSLKQEVLPLRLMFVLWRLSGRWLFSVSPETSTVALSGMTLCGTV